MRGMCGRPVAPVGGVVTSCRAYCPPRLTGRGAEGLAGGGLVLVKDRIVFEGCSPCSPRVLQRRKYTGLAAQWRE